MEYKDYSDLFENKTIGEYEIQISEWFDENFVKESLFNHYQVTIPDDKNLVKLVHTKTETLLSSNTSTEKLFYKCLEDLKGDVLVFGLGVGTSILPLLENTDIKSITVVEKQQEIIDLVSEIIKSQDISNKLEIIQADAYNFYETHSTKYNYVFIDIFSDLKSFNENSKNLSDNYQSLLKKGGSVIFWQDKFLEITNVK